MRLIQPYVIEWLGRGGTQEELSFLTGVSIRLIHDVIWGKRTDVRFHTADQLLIGMEKSYVWQWDDELADIYATA